MLQKASSPFVAVTAVTVFKIVMFEQYPEVPPPMPAEY